MTEMSTHKVLQTRARVVLELLLEVFMSIDKFVIELGK